MIRNSSIMNATIGSAAAVTGTILVVGTVQTVDINSVETVRGADFRVEDGKEQQVLKSEQTTRIVFWLVFQADM